MHHVRCLTDYTPFARRQRGSLACGVCLRSLHAQAGLEPSMRPPCPTLEHADALQRAFVSLRALTAHATN